MKRTLPVVLLAAICAAPIGEVLAQANPPTAMPSGRVARTVSASATVQSIDVGKRVVTLRGEDGKDLTVQVDERVKNLPQVKVGDRVQVNYREAVAFQVKPAGGLAPGMSMKEGLLTAKPGEKPAAIKTSDMTIVATIDAIDPAKPSVVLRTADGEVTEVRVRDPNNLAKVKVGDQVEVTYRTALAISVVDASAAAAGSPSPGKRSKTLNSAKDLNLQELERIQTPQ